jgi:CTP-dependent riboflavin kinase
VLPEIEAYPESRIEIIASVMLRDALGKGDGDEVVLEIGKRVAMAEPLTRGAAR